MDITDTISHVGGQSPAVTGSKGGDDMKYIVEGSKDDGSYEVEIEASSPREAAEGYVATCVLDHQDSETTWTRVGVWDAATRELLGWYTVAIEAHEPDCSDGEAHDWQSPFEIVGGLKENPGVWGHGGGVIIEEVCMRCGTGRSTDTWAQDRSTGEQGLTSVSYDEALYADEVEALRE